MRPKYNKPPEKVEPPDYVPYFPNVIEIEKRKIFSEIFAERLQQEEKWGEQNHPAEIWLAILSEEVGEASQALLHNKFGGDHVGTLRKELVQVAAVAVQWLECIDRDGGEFIEIFLGQSDLNEDD